MDVTCWFMLLHNRTRIFLCIPLERYLALLNCTFELWHNIESGNCKVSPFVDLMPVSENRDLPLEWKS